MAEPVQQQDILPWLKTLPVAPVFHPTLAEFQDPIAYIYKIEKEASQYGICKIVPPVPPPPKKTAITYLNRSLAERAAAGTGGGSSSSGSSSGPTFTTRQQQIGFCPRKARPVQKPVWQSGEYYTFQQFETKAKNFERSYLKKCGNRKAAVSALEIESLYWKATVDKPFSVEYANDMPGSAFAPARNGGEVAVGEGVTVGETAWNMRRVSRAKGSLLRFMKEEIPGVTSPMVYVAMMFSWFAWHAEDHDLHSLNYLHMGASKTWYGVPMEAANAFEEVVRVHGYGEEINPLVTFATLGEKTTMMSPEVFVGLGVPCCRLVQNAGEFVVTFPRAYHMGFSHGFNCGEAANIATPDWLNIAKAAAVRRASINYPPMVSHFQLLYDLAMAMHASIPVAVSAKPRSSRLKDKNKDEGETLVKELFVQDVAKNNRLLHILGKGSSIVLLPQSTSGALGANPRIPLGLCSYRGATKSSGSLVSNDILVARNNGFNPVKGYYSVKGKSTTLYERNSSFSGTDNIGTWSSQIRSSDSERRCTVQGDRSSDQRLFSCVTCGILSFACVAVIQPREPTARYLTSADCSFFNDRIVGSGVTGGGFSAAGGDAISSEQNSCPRWIRKSGPNSLYDVPVQSAGRIQAVDQTNESVSDRETKRDTSALNLLAMTYGYSSDSEEDRVEPNVPVHSDKENNMTECLLERKYQQDIHDAAAGSHNLSLPSLDCKDEAPSQIRDCYVNPGFRRENLNDGNLQISDCSVEFEIDKLDFSKSKGLDGRSGVPMSASYASNCSPAVHGAENVEFSKDIDPIKNADMSFAPRSHEDSSRMHVFCLEHAVEVEQQLRPIGGVNTLLLCHPDYPKMVAEAKLVAEELGIDSLCDDISFRNATKEDDKRIQLALDSEDAIPGNGDWAVKLGINLFYSANLSGSPLYSKQMPYNAVIYNAFGRNSLASSPTKSDNGRRPARQRKVVAGKWCGKVWMSNQVHPFLAQKDPEEQEQERSFSAWATPGENLERKPESTRQTLSTLVTRKYSRKRKTLAKCVSIKKPKSIDTEYAGSEYSQEGDPRLQQRRILGSKQARLLEKEDANSSDSPEDIYQQKMSVSRRKQAKYIEKEVGVPNDLLLGNSLKQYRRIPKRKEAKCIGREDAVSDDLPDDSSLKQYRRIPRSKIAKYVEREDGVSDNSLGGTSHRRHTRILKNKKSKCTDREDAISDYSLEDNSLQLQFKRIPESKHAEWIGREEAASDSLEDYSLRLQDKRIPNIKQTKCMESEDAVSDNSLEDDSHQLHRKRIPKSKQAKSMKRDDSISDDSLEDNSRQLYQRIPKSKQAKWIEREDAASDDSLEDYSHQQHRRIPSDKQSKSIEMEDILSYDSAEDNIQQPRRIPRSTAKFTEREDAVLYDLRDDNSYRKHGRTLRSKWLKTETLQKMKQETPSHVEPRKSRLKKQEIPQQVTSQQRRVRSNQNAKQFNSVVEEELEGGPSTRLRKRIPKPHESETKPKEKKQTIKKKVKNASAVKSPAGFSNARIKNGEAYQCDLEGCTMSFGTKQELVVHKKNICPVKGCGKKFFSHKYLVQHRRVHLDDRPLKCPWKGCKMTFKWAWARTEHIRVHTGARPYLCAEPGCGQTFRFVSDFSRHKRKTGHSTKKTRG